MWSVGGMEGRNQPKKGSIAAMVKALGLLPLWCKPCHESSRNGSIAAMVEALDVLPG